MRCLLAALIIATSPAAVMAQTAQAPAQISAVQAELRRQQRALQNVEGEIARLRGRTNASDEQSQRDIRRLQQLMEQKAALEQQISDTMKAGYEAQQGPGDLRKPS
jgi:flagellar motility protein MotE (MotC chaperone)